MSIIALLGRLVLHVIEQPGVRDVVSAVGRRIIQQATVRVVHAINQRTKLRKTEETFQ